MANNKGHDNLIPFSRRSEDEARENGAKGGRAIGESRRRKADFRRVLNALLTVEVDTDLTPMLKAMGVDSTLESAINAAIIKRALSGDVKAYNAIRDALGESNRIEPQQFADDGFIDALGATAAEDWTNE